MAFRSTGHFIQLVLRCCVIIDFETVATGVYYIVPLSNRSEGGERTWLGFRVRVVLVRITNREAKP